jgi:RNA polymerase-binding protein DksA
MEIKAKSKKVADLRAYLERERDRLRQEIAHSNVTTDEDRAGYGNHMADDATVVFEQARNMALKRGEELMLVDVEEALARIKAGTYGVCRHCGVAIDAARLRALPAAVLCIACQDRAEAR